MDKQLTPLSASRLKTFESCSWIYWCKYILKLPDKPNAGSLSGSCCHMILENLARPKNKKRFDAIIKNGGFPFCDKAIERYVRSYIKKHGLPDTQVNEIEKMLSVAFNKDFLCQNANKETFTVELPFDITDPTKSYRILGFIDKYAEYPEKGLCRIVDYKSSKRKFSGEDLDENVQAKMYSLVGKYRNPALAPVVEFLFLKFPEDPVQRLRFSVAELDAFEVYLSECSAKLNNFGYKDAVKNFAAKQQYPKEGFGGPLMCGKCKQPNMLKTDGSPQWYCQYKFAFDYYVLCGENDEVVKTSFTPLEENPAKNQYVVKKSYKGCPAFAKK